MTASIQIIIETAFCIGMTALALWTVYQTISGNEKINSDTREMLIETLTKLEVYKKALEITIRENDGCHPLCPHYDECKSSASLDCNYADTVDDCIPKISIRAIELAMLERSKDETNDN